MQLAGAGCLHVLVVINQPGASGGQRRGPLGDAGHSESVAPGHCEPDAIVRPVDVVRDEQDDQLANRVFERLYTIRVVMKRLKARSRTTYYVLSYAAKLAPIAALLWLALR